MPFLLPAILFVNLLSDELLSTDKVQAYDRDAVPSVVATFKYLLHRLKASAYFANSIRDPATWAMFLTHCGQLHVHILMHSHRDKGNTGISTRDVELEFLQDDSCVVGWDIERQEMGSTLTLIELCLV